MWLAAVPQPTTANRTVTRGAARRPCARPWPRGRSRASEYATPTGTMSDRPTSASVCGHRPGPYSRSVGCSARRGPPLLDACQRDHRGVQVDGPPAVHLRGTARPRRAARRRTAWRWAHRGRNHVMLEQPSPSGRGGAGAPGRATRRSRRGSAPCSPAARRGSRAGVRAARRPPHRRARPCAGSRPRTAR